jgi:cytochrome c oxidase subunit 2
MGFRVKGLRTAAWALGVLAAATAAGTPALADIAKPWQILFQEPASPVMERIVAFNDLISAIIVLITVFVLALLLYVAVKFNEKANPVPSTTTHNTTLEVVWTVIPVLILVVIGIPSLKLLYYMDRHADPDMTLKVTGHQWYWSYEYPDHGGFGFDSIPVEEAKLKPGEPRLLTVDNQVVLPVDTNVRILQTSADVIHAWSIPALGVKVDATPGRVNENWVRIVKEGVYYGQCMELCGVNHYFMPIAIRAVSKDAFKDWVEKAKKQFAGSPAGGGVPAEEQMTVAAVPAR